MRHYQPPKPWSVTNATSLHASSPPACRSCVSSLPYAAASFFSLLPQALASCCVLDVQAGLHSGTSVHSKAQLLYTAMSSSSGPPTQLVLAVHTVEAATAKVNTEAAYARPTDSFHVSTCCCLLVQHYFTAGACPASTSCLFSRHFLLLLMLQVPFAMILLLDFAKRKATPPGCKCRMVSVQCVVLQHQECS